MKRFCKRWILVVAVLSIWIFSFGGLFDKPVTLDVSKKTSGAFSEALTDEKSIGGAMNYRVPKAFSTVETNLDGIAGNLYRLNEMSSNKKKAAEQVYVYYFSNEKYLLNLNEKTKTAAIEMAIVENILPGERVSVDVDIWNFPMASKKSPSGISYDYYVTSFVDSSRKRHNVEFAFTKDGDRGLGCFLYVFTDSVHKEDILYVMDSVRFAP